MQAFEGICLQALKGPTAVAMAVIRGEGGVLGLYKGTVATLWREIPGNAAMFGTYEVVKQWMARRQVRPDDHKDFRVLPSQCR